jgi:hypothetical protein
MRDATTIEATGKRWKAIQAWGGAALVLGLAVLLFGAYAESTALYVGWVFRSIRPVISFHSGHVFR